MSQVGAEVPCGAAAADALEEKWQPRARPFHVSAGRPHAVRRRAASAPAARRPRRGVCVPVSLPAPARSAPVAFSPDRRMARRRNWLSLGAASSLASSAELPGARPALRTRGLSFFFWRAAPADALFVSSPAPVSLGARSGRPPVRSGLCRVGEPRPARVRGAGVLAWRRK